jgi:3-oxoacyl-[acyl-carrier-protein] synthase II
MARSIREAGCRLEDIVYINTHGTSTELNDRFEARAIKDLFGEHAGKLALNATKSMIGHSLGAAGAVEASVTILSMRDGILHPTLNLEDPDPECEGLNIITGQAENLDMEYALSNSLGFGGHNVTLCLKRT